MKQNISTFARAYIIAALWSSNDDNGEPLDSNYGIDDIAPESLAVMIQEADAFANANRADIEAAELDDDRAGHSFWLNRCSHGSGYWDEYMGDDPRREPCNRLSDASHAAGSRDIYVGDDGRLYQYPG